MNSHCPNFISCYRYFFVKKFLVALLFFLFSC